MSFDDDDSKDRDLLARLNALRQSSVDLNTKSADEPSYATSSSAPNSSSNVALPARDLHHNLLARFNSLKGQRTASENILENQDVSTPAKNIEDESGTTFEELLAGLGPVEEWNVDKSENEQIEDLLSTAKETLSQATNKSTPEEKYPEGESIRTGKESSSQFPNIDVEVFQPEPESDAEEEPSSKGGKTAESAIDKEADDLLRKLLDDIRRDFGSDSIGADVPHGADVDYELKDPYSDTRTLNTESDNESDALAGVIFPTVPSDEPSLQDPANPANKSSITDDELAARFASLSLPTVTDESKSAAQSALIKQSGPAYDDEEIDTWCIICNDDATLRCIGCDGDLFCTNCWMEGHQSEDAGFEERKHKAIQYVKGGGKKKQKARNSRRVMAA